MSSRLDVCTLACTNRFDLLSVVSGSKCLGKQSHHQTLSGSY